MHFLGIGINRYNRRFSVPFAYGTWEIFLDGDEFVKIDAAPFVNDAKSANAKHFFKAPFPENCP